MSNSNQPAGQSADKTDHKMTKAKVKKSMLRAIEYAGQCAHAYAKECETDEERTWALNVWERIRNSSRS